MTIDEIKEFLKKNNLKVTPVRLQVLKVLLESDIALSHSDISIKLADGNIDKVTLYRTLNNFHEKGIIHKVATEDRNWLYAILIEDESKPEPDHSHAHFVCDDCDKIFCFPLSTATNESVRSIKQGFLVKEQEIRLHGLCPSCLS